MALVKDGAGRPLSPHLQVYRLTTLMAMSILHRVTGAANFFGFILVAWWLLALASGPEAYAAFQAVAGSPLGLLVLFGYSWSLLHHMMGGLRHLIWDTGAAMAVPQAKRLAQGSMIASAGLTVFLWLVVMLVR